MSVKPSWNDAGNADVFRPPQTAAALAVGSAGTLILGLQPVLLGALLSEGRVTFDGLAMIATIEILAIGIGSVLFSSLLRPIGMRGRAAALLLLAALGQIATGFADSLLHLVVLRGVTGLIEGGLVAVAIELIARSRSPSRTGGWFVVMQTIAQSLLTLLLAFFILTRFGSSGGFAALGVAILALIALLPLLPNSYGPLPKPADNGGASGFGLAAIAALLAIFTLYLFIGALWAFLEPIGAQSGVDAQTVGLIVSLTLLVQVAGALIATFIENRISYPVVLGGAALVAIVIATAYGLDPPAGLFWVLSFATGFLWLFVVPWQIAMTLAADESRRTALLVPAAQLFGAALGPAGASAFLDGVDFHPVGWFAAAAAIASLVFVVVVVLLTARQGRR